MTGDEANMQLAQAQGVFIHDPTLFRRNTNAVILGTGSADAAVATVAAFAIARSAFAYEKLQQHEKVEKQRLRAVSLLVGANPPRFSTESYLTNSRDLLMWLQSSTFYNYMEALN